MAMIINPGSGPVHNATFEHAEANIKHYITDCKLQDVQFVHLPDQDDDGRFAFLLFDQDNTRCHTVEMPGIPLEKVRYMSNEGQNIWDFPRLYIDGSSWIWCFGMLEPKDFNMPEDM
jgi:hypothetical protein